MAAGANCKSLRLHTRWTIRHSLNRWRNQLSSYLTRNRRFVLTISVPYPLATIEYRYNEEEEIRGGVRQLPGIRRGPVNSAVFVAAMRKRSPLSTPVTHPSDNTWNVIDNALFATCAALTVPTTAAPRRAPKSSLWATVLLVRLPLQLHSIPLHPVTLLDFTRHRIPFYSSSLVLPDRQKCNTSLKYSSDVRFVNEMGHTKYV